MLCQLFSTPRLLLSILLDCLRPLTTALLFLRPSYRLSLPPPSLPLASLEFSHLLQRFLLTLR
jgi:hypothetical protein